MKSTLALLSFGLLAACATPTSIKIDGEQTVTVHNLDKVTLPKAEVLDQNGKPMEGQTISWEVTPAEVAALGADGKDVEPKADGEAKVTAKSGSLAGSMSLVVSLPDTIEIGGVAEGEVINLNDTKNLTGTVKADGTAIEGQTVEFSSSDAAILKIENGVATGVAVGDATITAKSGALTAELAVKDGDAAAAAAATTAPAGTK